MLKQKVVFLALIGIALLCSCAVKADQWATLYSWNCVSTPTGWDLTGAWKVGPGCGTTGGVYISAAIGNDGCSTNKKCVLGHSPGEHHQDCVCSVVEIADDCTDIPSTQKFCYTRVNM